MNDKVKNLMVRTASGTVLAALTVGAILWSPIGLMAFAFLVMIGAILEFYALCKHGGYSPRVVLGTVLATALFAIVATTVGTHSNIISGDGIAHGATICFAMMLLTIPTIFISEIFARSTTPIANIATTFMGIMYAAFPMALFVMIAMILGGTAANWQPWRVIAFITIVWINDVFAYLVGISIGKHRLCERISPKKSIEGFVGGVVAAIAGAALYGYIFGDNIFVWAGLGAIVAVTGVAGDLVESLFKRSVGVKDSGSIMPGHGGVLDRFDALLIAIPFAFVYIVYFFA